MKKLMQLEQLEAHASAVSMDALHVASAADCIVGSCGAGTATSTWWRTTRWTSSSGGGAVAPTEEEEQARLPPVSRGSVRLCMAVRVAMPCAWAATGWWRG